MKGVLDLAGCGCIPRPPGLPGASPTNVRRSRGRSKELPPKPRQGAASARAHSVEAASGRAQSLPPPRSPWEAGGVVVPAVTIAHLLEIHDDADLADIVAAVLDARRPLVQRLLERSGIRKHTRTLLDLVFDGDCASEPKHSCHKEEPVTVNHVEVDLEVPIVEFASAQHIEDEAADEVVLSLMRTGDCSVRSSVPFSTIDNTAKAGISYKETHGTVVFKPGETWKEIRIPLEHHWWHREWHTMEEFTVQLESEGARNAILGDHLWKTRVKLHNDDGFPTAKFLKKMDEDSWKIPDWALLSQYWLMNWYNAVVQRGTVKILFLYMLQNFYFLVTLYLDVFLVDTILQDDFTWSQLSLYGVAFFLLFGLVHLVDYQRLQWRVGGTSVKILQGALFRKFLHMDHQRHAKLRNSDVIMAITSHADRVVGGYLGMLSLMKAVGKLVAGFLFQVLRPVVLGQPIGHWQFILGVWPLLGYPLFLLVGLAARTRTTTRALEQRSKEELSLLELVQDAVLNYQLVRDFRGRSWAVDCFEKRIMSKNNAVIYADQVLLNNLYAAKWLSKLFILIYLVVGGMEFMEAKNRGDQALTLGMFLATLRAQRNIGVAWVSIYENCLHIIQTIPALRQMVIFLNFRSEVRTFEPHLKERIARTKELFMEVDGKYKRMPIRLESSEVTQHGAGRHCSLTWQGGLEIQQGTLVYLVGSQAGGKSTLLRMLAGVLRPTDPRSVFVPSHLRLLHMSFDCMFFRGTLLHNLTCGVTPGDPDANKERVKAICRRVGLSEEVIQLVEQETETIAWEDALSQSECFLLNLVRALVTNPEVMCIHKPALPYDQETSCMVWTSLLQFVRERGLQLDPETWHLRHPRTCIVSGPLADVLHHVKYADQVVRVERNQLTRLK